MSRPFAKYEGLGNDFVVLDAHDWPEGDVTPGLAKRLCDRHRGVGADGVLWLSRATLPRLIIYNADGSRPEMCGNGVRCVAAALVEQGALTVGEARAVVTDAGERTVIVQRAERGSFDVDVEMGGVHVARVMDLVIDGAYVRVAPVDVGNPHAVVLDAVHDGLRERVADALVARRDVWPQGVNVEFVVPSASGGGAHVAVRERGVGWTLACGTGACAVVAAAVRHERWGAKLRARFEVHLPGGTLRVQIDEDPEGGLHARMSGPARRTFRGTWEEGSA